MDANELLKALLTRLKSIDIRLKMVEDRVGVVEDNTISHETRLQEIEEGLDNEG